MTRQVHLCNCNRSMPLAREELERAACLAGATQVRSYEAMCRQEIERLVEGAEGDVAVACTQESRLLGEALSAVKRVDTVRFFNVRERAGWSNEGRFAGAKITALVAEALLPDPTPTPLVEYRSRGQTLVIGPLAEAVAFADAAKDHVEISILSTESHGDAVPAARDYPIVSGSDVRVRGWLGAFDVEWQQTNPIDLDACVRCGACVRTCPEDAIGTDLQVDLSRCRSHRDCVAACGEVGAIDFARPAVAAKRGGRFDIVVNLSERPLFAQHQPPQGYLEPERTPMGMAQAIARLLSLVGEFEKPRYFHYRASMCAHGRNQMTGCTRCIDICSTRAIRSCGDTVEVTPELCMGCGACTTVCPSGALTYAFPRPSDLGLRLKTLLAAYRSAGGRDPTVLIHDQGAGDALIAAFACQGAGLPASCLPLSVHHPAAVGIDLWLAAFAWGASGVTVLLTRDIAPEYVGALSEQADLTNTILAALGYQGSTVRVADEHSLESALRKAPRGLAVRVEALWNVGNDKRATVETALQHLLEHAPTPRDVIPLVSGAPFGAIAVAQQRCTMCLACVGACPEGALLDNPAAPELRLIESKCVQCGLCAKTCPEEAISLLPQLDLRPSARRARTLNAAEVAACIRCGKPMGAQPIIERMLSRLSDHRMFADPAAKQRLRMCADCRVIDLFAEDKSLDIRDLP